MGLTEVFQLLALCTWHMHLVVSLIMNCQVDVCLCWTRGTNIWGELHALVWQKRQRLCSELLYALCSTLHAMLGL